MLEKKLKPDNDLLPNHCVKNVETAIEVHVQSLAPLKIRYNLSGLDVEKKEKTELVSSRRRDGQFSQMRISHVTSIGPLMGPIIFLLRFFGVRVVQKTKTRTI